MKLFTECVTRKDETLYFASIESNLIFSFDIRSNNTCVVTSVEGEKQLEKRLFGDILTWKDKFVLVPSNAKNIWIVDASFSKWEKIELEHPDVPLKFLCAQIVDDEIYMLKHLYPYTICLNLRTREKNRIETGTDFFTGVEYYDGELYFASCNSNRLYTYDVREKSLMINNLDYYNMSGIYYNDDKFFLTTREGNGIAELSCKKEIIQSMSICKAIAVFRYNGIYHIPLWAENTQDIPQNNQMVFLCKSINAKRADNDTWCVFDREANITIYDNKEKRIIKGKLSVPRQQLSKYNKRIKKREVFEESDIFDLEEYIEMLTSN